MKNILFILTICTIISCKQEDDRRTQYFPRATETLDNIPVRKNVWAFILAGQSNMAGRGQVEPQDTLPDNRVLTVNRDGQIIIAKEPLHFYEPLLTGLDCGLSFGKTLVGYLPDSVSILLLPAAVGGSSVEQWIGDSTYRNVKLLSNFNEKIEIGKEYGQIKGILWHQGESDANPNDIPQYKEKLSKLFELFRMSIGNDSLPILIGELGAYSEDKEEWEMINRIIQEYTSADSNTTLISTIDLTHKGDYIHFNSEGQRTIGKRFAEAYLKRIK